MEKNSRLVEAWERDTSISRSDDSAEDNSNYYIDEVQERQKYVEEYVNESIKYFQENFDYIHDQNMEYFRDQQNYYADNDLDHRPMLGPVDDGEDSNQPEYDPDLDAEVNNVLKDLEEELMNEDVSTCLDPEKDAVNPKKEQYEDYYDDFPEEEPEPVPDWYEHMLKKKAADVKTRMHNLSNIASYCCLTAREKILRLEQDHGTPFCKMGFPRHRPLSKPWVNYWRFNCLTRCKEDPIPPGHAHTSDCETIILENDTGISIRSKNLQASEFPVFVMYAVEIFQEFVNETSKWDVPVIDSVYEKPSWCYIKLRSNYKNELQLICCGKAIRALLPYLTEFFKTGKGKISNVISVYCIDIRWSQKKNKFPATHLWGKLLMRDKIGPISLEYDPKTNINFNSYDALQLGKVMLEFLEPTKETMVLDIGCNFGVLSLIMATRSDLVIGLNTLEHEIRMAEEIQAYNKLNNASFIMSLPRDVFTKCKTFAHGRRTVAILNLATAYGKGLDVIKALRNIPSLWRVVIYGSFQKEHFNQLTLLMSKDDNLGEEFLPVQGCMLDKSPTILKKYELVILFERNPLIEVKLEKPKPKPDLICKSEYDAVSSDDSRSSGQKFPVPKKGFVGFPKKNGIKYEKFERPSRKFGKFDSPLLPIEEPPPPIPPVIKEEPPPPPPSEIPPLHSLLTQKPPPPPPLKTFANKPIKERHVHAVRTELQVKELKKMYDSPSLPIEPAPLPVYIPPPPKEPTFSCAILKQENAPFDTRVKKEQNLDGVKKPGKPYILPIPRQSSEPFSCEILRKLENSVPKKEPFDQKAHKRKFSFKPKTRNNSPPQPVIPNQYNNPPQPIIPNQYNIPPQPIIPNQYNIPPQPIIPNQYNSLQQIPPIQNCNLQQIPPNQNDGSQQIPSIQNDTHHPILPTQNNNDEFIPTSQMKKEKDVHTFPSIKIEKEEIQTLPPSQIKKEKLDEIINPACVKKEKDLIDSTAEQSSTDSLKTAITVDQIPIIPPHMIKKEKEKDSVPEIVPLSVKIERKETPDSKEEGELSSDDTEDTAHTAVFKTEPIDSDDLEILKVTKREPVVLDIIDLKTELINSPELSIKSEKTLDMNDFENMKTPIHNPRYRSPSSSPLPSANFKTSDGFEFKVNSNNSFLPRVKVESPQMNEEICIVGEKKSKGVISLTKNNRVKKEDDDPDVLRKLIQQKKLIQMQLDKDKDFSRCRKRDRSPSPIPSKKFRRQDSVSPSPTKYRSPSRERYGKRAYSPYRRRSKRSSVSPHRSTHRRSSSPSRSVRSSAYSPDRRYRRSPGRRYQRSPESPSRTYTRATLNSSYRSTYENRYRDSSISPPPYVRSRRSSISPERKYRSRRRSSSLSRSPSLPYDRRIQKSRSPSHKRRSRSRSLSHDRPIHKKKRTKENSEGLKKKKKKKKSKSKSKSKERDESLSKKTKKKSNGIIDTMKNDDTWDIPGLSSLSSEGSSSNLKKLDDNKELIDLKT